MDRHADTSARDDKRGILFVIVSGDCACASVFMLSLRENPQGFSWQSIFTLAAMLFLSLRASAIAVAWQSTKKTTQPLESTFCVC